MSLFLVSVVDENNLREFGRICLEVDNVVPGPLSDVVELGLPTAVVNTAGLTTAKRPGRQRNVWYNYRNVQRCETSRWRTGKVAKRPTID